MENLTLIVNIIGNLFIGFFVIYSCNIFLNRKINLKDYKAYLVLLILTVCGVLCSLFLPNYLRIVVSAIILFLLNYFLFCKSAFKSMAMVIVVDIVLLFSELITSILVFFSYNITGNTNQNNDSFVFFSLAIPIVAFLILKIGFPLKSYNYLVKSFCNMKKTNLIVYFVTTLVLISLFLIISYMKLPPVFVLACNSFLTVVYIIIVFKLANIKESYKSVYSKYETSLSSLKEYEDIMDQYRVDNHENKNQLLTIRNMVKAKDKTVIKYIDKLVDNKIKDNESIFYKTSKIPEGGLRATIYSKLCKMKDIGIDYSLEIANDVRTVDLIKMGNETMLNICKIVGVFLDNAIEAVEELDEKDIIVEIFGMDNYLCVEISNNYKEEIIIDKISNKGYSTKGKGHGYGLSLVSELVKQDSNLENEREISKDLFTQRLKIKM